MKYFFVSDLHGCDVKTLQFYLAQKSFNPEQDALVVVGDIVDRGYFTMDLVKWINTLPHVIRIWGNHDLRTRQIILGIGPKADMYDKHNGVGATLHSLCGLTPEDDKKNLWYYLNALIPGNPTAQQNTIELVDNYFRKCVWALEFSDLIVTHAWLPHTHKPMNYHLMGLENLHKIHWEDATWANSVECLRKHLLPNKKMLVGHWWAADIRAEFEKHRLLDDMLLDGTIDFSTFEYNNVIFIDPCVSLSHTINVYVYSSDEEPQVYITGSDDYVVKKPLSEADL